MPPNNFSDEGDKPRELEQVEDLSLAQAFTHQGWRASTPHEAALDRRVNLKMDCIIVFILTAGFLVSGSSLAQLPAGILWRLILH